MTALQGLLKIWPLNFRHHLDLHYTLHSTTPKRTSRNIYFLLAILFDTIDACLFPSGWIVGNYFQSVNLFHHPPPPPLDTHGHRHTSNACVFLEFVFIMRYENQLAHKINSGIFSHDLYVTNSQQFQSRNSERPQVKKKYHVISSWLQT